MDGVEVDTTQANTDGSQENPALEAARVRFRIFFDELRGRFLEREDTIEQVALALLAKEHVLLTGPPGTAKSALARAVLQNVVDKDSGLPSLFARQFTESTVQTDLIGPVDFKTLMASGRSEHFTDEGMLGAVHAFLDEVLDGRDMLLRTTLNVLQERELKQGTKTTAGAIECAVMTTNRYLSEVIEESRETLLAFVDRIAFISFVPKGFTDPRNLVKVLNGQLGPRARTPLPKLTIQDVDLLQELTNYVRMPEDMTSELVLLLGRLEAELVSATRADPRFVPTRYLSTRTAVRTAQILKACVVYDWITCVPNRPLCVRASDFARLRLTLLLAGPDSNSLAAALEREVDPRERRQLSICQTEQQIFGRVLSAVINHPPPVPSRTPPLPSLDDVRAMPLTDQIRACQDLAQRAEGGLTGLEARRRLQSVIELLAHELVSESLGAGISELTYQQALDGLLDLARLLDETHPKTKCFAPILRTRALELLEAQLNVVPTLSTELVRELARGVFTFTDATKHSRERLQRFGSALDLRASLLQQAAQPRATSELTWKQGSERVLEELVHIWELAFSRFLAGLKSDAPLRLAELLETIRNPLHEMNTCGRWFVPLGQEPNCVAARVLATKLMPYIEAALTSEQPKSRAAVAQAVELLLQRLDDADALYAISSTALIQWVARALLKTNDALADNSEQHTLNYEGYRSFRKAQATSSVCHTLVATCTHIAQYALELRAKHPPSLVLVQAQLGELTDDTVAQISQIDEQRIRDTLQYFERWWDALGSTFDNPQQQLTQIVDSRFYELLEQESVLLRFTLEAELLGTLFPSCNTISRTLVTDLAAFRDKVQNRIQGLTQSTGSNGDAQ